MGNRPDWGAGLRSLGESLAGYAQQDYARKQAEYELEKAKEQQAADRKYADDLYYKRLAEERKYNEGRYSLEHPMVDLPPESIDIPWMGGGASLPAMQAPNQQRPVWAIPGMNQVPRDFYLEQQAKIAQDAIDAKKQADRDLVTHGYDMERDAAQVAAGKYKRGLRGDGSNDPMGGLKSADWDNLVDSFITKDEIDVQGDAYRGGFEVILRNKLESGMYHRPDGGIDITQASVDAENELRGTWAGMPNFGTMTRTDVGGQGIWTEPSLVERTPAVDKFGWWNDAEAGWNPRVPETEMTAAQQQEAAQRLSDQTYFRDNIAPKVLSGLVSIKQLQEWAKKQNVPWTINDINSWLQGGMGEQAAASATEGF